MEDIKNIDLPLEEADILSLRAGDRVMLSGILYTGRDKAHARMIEALNAGEPLPVDLSGQMIYYAGPTPTKKGQIIGSIGPTTSSRMDAFSPQLMAQAGLKGTLGKGPRSQEVIKAMVEYQGIYMVAIGGTGALISQAVKKVEVVAYADLGTEAIRRLEVENLPAIVAIDCQGNNLLEEGRLAYQEKS